MTRGNLKRDTRTDGDLISIVMAAYNAERTIGDAIRSVLAQTHANFELLINDDASKDGTVQVVESFSDVRIKLIKSTINAGPGPARDRAIDSARGVWITFLDADDQYVPDRLEKLLSVAVKYPDDLIADAIMDCHDTPSGLVPWRVVWDECHFYALEGGARIVKFEQFLREHRQLIQPFFRHELAVRLRANHGEKMNGEDMAFLFHFFAYGSVIRYVPCPMYLYRMTPGSLSTKSPDRFRVYREVFEDGRILFANDLSATMAIDAKIASIRRLEIYQEFFSPLRSGHWGVAWRVFMREPWVLREFLRRMIQRMPFHIDRVMHRGKPRRVG